MVNLLLNNKKILVVAGGWSSERNVSLTSGRNVFKALKQLKYNVNFLDLKKNNIDKIFQNKPHIIFNSLHGEFGEDGGLTCISKKNNLIITHSDQISSSLCMNKKLTKYYLKQNIKINVPRTFSFNKINQYPVIIKPNNGGSSYGVKIIKSKNELVKYIKRNKELIIEEYIKGEDLTVTVIENNNKVKALGVTSIKYNSKIYDYKAKYIKGYSSHELPAKIPSNDYQYLLRISEQIFKLLGCKSIARIDFLLDNSSKKNKYYFLECNTHPGLTDISLAPEQANFVGISYSDLITMILKSSNA